MERRVNVCTWITVVCPGRIKYVAYLFILPGTLNNTLRTAGSSDDHHVLSSLTVTRTFETWTDHSRVHVQFETHQLLLWGSVCFSTSGELFREPEERVNIECREEGLPLSHAETYQYSALEVEGISMYYWQTDWSLMLAMPLRSQNEWAEMLFLACSSVWICGLFVWVIIIIESFFNQLIFPQDLD